MCIHVHHTFNQGLFSSILQVVLWVFVPRLWLDLLLLFWLLLLPIWAFARMSTLALWSAFHLGRDCLRLWLCLFVFLRLFLMVSLRKTWAGGPKTPVVSSARGRKAYKGFLHCILVLSSPQQGMLLHLSYSRTMQCRIEQKVSEVFHGTMVARLQSARRRPRGSKWDEMFADCKALAMISLIAEWLTSYCLIKLIKFNSDIEPFAFICGHPA